MFWEKHTGGAQLYPFWLCKATPEHTFKVARIEEGQFTGLYGLWLGDRQIKTIAHVYPEEAIARGQAVAEDLIERVAANG